MEVDMGNPCKKYKDCNDDCTACAPDNPKRSGTIHGRCTVEFTYDKDDYVLDYINIDEIEECDRFKGKKFGDLNSRELRDAFRDAFYSLIYDSCAEIDVGVEIDK